MIKLVYLAGPYRADTRWDEESNVRRAEEVAYLVAQTGAFPVTPHANTRPYFADAQPPEFWLAATLELMRRCDIVVMLPGWSRSEGAKAERVEAMLLGKMVFDDLATFCRWMEGQAC